MIYIVWILDDLTMNPELHFFHNKKAADEFLKNNPNYNDEAGGCRSGMKATTWIPAKKRFCERASWLLGR